MIVSPTEDEPDDHMEAQGQPDAHRGWIHSARYDMPLIMLSPVAGLFLIWSSQTSIGVPAGILVMYLLAIPHYVSSFTFFMGDENLGYYKTRRTAFFLGPVFIVVIYAIALMFDGRIIQSAMFSWNVFHVARQSGGILSVYRRLNGGPQSERNVTQTAILAVNGAMVLAYIERFDPLYELLVMVHPRVPDLLAAGSAGVAVVSLVALLSRVVQRSRPIAFPEGAFLVTSLLLFHPYLWVADYQVATVAMLVGHFIQYLTIVWLLNHRKYRGSKGSKYERALAAVSARPQYVALWILGIGLTFFAFQQATAFFGVGRVYLIAWNLLALLHFYTDGLVWAFKRPYVRESIGPFVAPESHLRK